MAPAKKAGKKKKSDDKGTASVKNYGILLEPVVTEKSSQAGGAGVTVTFKVHQDATKTEIREAVERIFQKDVAKVRTINMAGKPKQRANSVGRRVNYKKAFITLKEGQTLDVVEGI